MARPARRTGNLPAEAASFIGRRRELAQVRRRLTEARLVSLVGPGGVGKTRLAVRIAADLARGFRDGGWLVELAEVGDPALVSIEWSHDLLLGREAALGLALGQGQGDGGAPRAGLLANREADVARLIADGLANRQIGARLFISERTVDSHVRNILNKLGFGSRAQIAAWVAGLDGV
jgi:DNA-binding CsgD family transcriptional regulator